MASLCRLCGKDVDIGFGLFNDVKPEPLSSIINKYLPIKILKDPSLPDKICEYCNMNVGTMVDFINKIIEGQQILRLLLYSKEKSQEENLFNSGSSEIETYPSGDSRVSPNIIEDIVNLQDNPYLKTCMEGKKPKRRRGRPRKLPDNTTLNLDFVEPKERAEVPGENLLRPPRIKNKPLRFRDGEISNFTENLSDSESSRCESLPLKQEFNFIDREFYNIPKGEKMHKLEDTTVIVASDDFDPLLKQPEAVNIELNFEIDASLKPTSNSPEDLHPRASIYSVSAPPSENLERWKRRHEKVKKKMFSCELCMKSFVHRGRLATHIRLHKDVILQCIECKCNFSTKEDLDIHQEKEHHSEFGLLEINENDTADTLVLKENLENISLSCPQCPKVSFSNQVEYNAHVRFCHAEKKWYKCSHCLKLFSYKHNLANHIIMHKMKNEKRNRYPCEKCDRVFEHYASLVYHREAKHSGDRKYVCSICNAHFDHRQLLHRHYIVHSDQRPFKCNYCPSSFKTYGVLYNHMSIHTNKREHECTYCSKKFNHSTSLRQHLRSHTGEKPFECQHCKKCFSQKSNLIYHVRIHTGERPYKCSLCNVGFISATKMKIHKKKHLRHEEKRKELGILAGFNSSNSNLKSLNPSLNLNLETSSGSIEVIAGPIEEAIPAENNVNF